MEVEAFPIRFTRGIRSYWGRRKYQRLEAANGGGKTRATQQLGGARRGGGWGLRLRRLLRVRVRVAKALSPVRLLARIRDAYVGGMLAVSRKASAMALPNAPEGLWPRRVPRRKQLRAPGPGQLTDFEQRLVVEIYKSIVASKELTTMLHHSTAHLPQHNTAPNHLLD
ncbi:hypothetical protein E2562_029210 [Oryza meyeriana var. granulata]|uniref:Uncharacterized protein n=1 Tax=Oryza meyeriana var. granulata TaxID=110450 RepID=A0A6G1EQY5_9ORYZ|nr:hypothetical protein E2562_029210 [Oryza meyeriana var. granulata]